MLIFKWMTCFCVLQVYLWYPLSLITGGTTAKIMVAAKDNFLGKYIYKDTIARNLAAVIYKVSLILACASNSIAYLHIKEKKNVIYEISFVLAWICYAIFTFRFCIKEIYVL